MRNQTIDIMKGILIILVVYGHCNLPGTHFLYLFHMPVFFMISGYFINSTYLESKEQFFIFLKKRLISLWLPYFLFNGIGCLLNNFFVKIYFLSENERKTIKNIIIDFVKTFFFRGGATNIGGATWFLRILFESLFVFMIVYKVVILIISNTREKKLYSIMILGIIFFLVLFFLRRILTYNIIDDLKKIVLVLPLLFMGYVIRFLFDRNNRHNISKCVSIYTFFSFLFLFFLNKSGSIEIAANIITNPLYFIICSVCGWFFIYGLSFFISKVRYLNTFIEIIGKSSLYILLFHFLIFKFVNLFIVVLCHLSLTEVSVFPTLKGNTFWGVMYVFLGVGIPCLINKIQKSISYKRNMQNCLNSHEE